MKHLLFITFFLLNLLAKGQFEPFKIEIYNHPKYSIETSYKIGYLDTIINAIDTTLYNENGFIIQRNTRIPDYQLSVVLLVIYSEKMDTVDYIVNSIPDQNARVKFQFLNDSQRLIFNHKGELESKLDLMDSTTTFKIRGNERRTIIKEYKNHKCIIKHLKIIQQNYSVEKDKIRTKKYVWITFSKVKKEFNKNRHVVKEIEKLKSKEDDGSKYKTEQNVSGIRYFNYDKKGNVSNSYTYSLKGVLTDSSLYTYKYDSLDNWIVKREYTKNGIQYGDYNVYEDLEDDDDEEDETKGCFYMEPFSSYAEFLTIRSIIY